MQMSQITFSVYLFKNIINMWLGNASKDNLEFIIVWYKALFDMDSKQRLEEKILERHTTAQQNTIVHLISQQKHQAHGKKRKVTQKDQSEYELFSPDASFDNWQSDKGT